MREFKFNNNKVKFYSLLIAGALIVSLILSYLIEVFYFGSFKSNRDSLSMDQIVESTEGIEQDKDGMFIITNPERALITFSFPLSYVNKIVFTTKTYGQRLNYEIQYKEALNIRNEISYDSFVTETETAVIDSETEAIHIVFIEPLDRTAFNLTLNELDYSNQFNPIRFLSVFICCLIIIYTLYLILQLIPFKFENVGATYALVFGLLIAFLTPPTYGLDEYQHIIKALNTANGNLHTEVTGEQLYPDGFEQIKELDYRSYADYQDEINRMSLYNSSHESVRKLKDTSSGALSYTFFPYVLSAIGINVARFLHINLFYWAFFARIGNVLLYALCLFWALKLFPSNKPLLFFFSLIPIIFGNALIVSTACLTSSCIILAIGYLGYLIYDKENITWLNYLFLMLLFFFITCGRMPYGIFALVALLLPNKKMESVTLRKTNKILTVLLTGIFMLGIYLYANSISLAIQALEGVDPAAQKGFILENIFRYIRILWEFSSTSMLANGLLIEFGQIPYNGYLTSLFIFFEIIIFIYLTLTGNNDELVFDSWYSKILVWILFLLSIAITETAMYITHTEVAAYSVSGFNARYAIGVLIFPFLTFQGKNFYIQYNKKILDYFVSCYALLILILMTGTLIVKYYR